MVEMLLKDLFDLEERLRNDQIARDKKFFLLLVRIRDAQIEQKRLNPLVGVEFNKGLKLILRFEAYFSGNILFSNPRFSEDERVFVVDTIKGICVDNLTGYDFPTRNIMEDLRLTKEERDEESR